MFWTKKNFKTESQHNYCCIDYKLSEIIISPKFINSRIHWNDSVDEAFMWVIRSLCHATYVNIWAPKLWERDIHFLTLSHGQRLLPSLRLWYMINYMIARSDAKLVRNKRNCLSPSHFDNQVFKNIPFKTNIFDFSILYGTFFQVPSWYSKVNIIIRDDINCEMTHAADLAYYAD